MAKLYIDKLFYCPVKSLSFNDSNKFIIDCKVGIINDRCIAFTRGLSRSQSQEYAFDAKIRNLNFFLTLKNSPFLKKYNFILNNDKLELFNKRDKLIEININNGSQILGIENFIEKWIEKVYLKRNILPL